MPLALSDVMSPRGRQRQHRTGIERDRIDGLDRRLDTRPSSRALQFDRGTAVDGLLHRDARRGGHRHGGPWPETPARRPLAGPRQARFRSSRHRCRGASRRRCPQPADRRRSSPATASRCPPAPSSPSSAAVMAFVWVTVGPIRDQPHRACAGPMPVTVAEAILTAGGIGRLDLADVIPGVFPRARRCRWSWRWRPSSTRCRCRRASRCRRRRRPGSGR